MSLLLDLAIAFGVVLLVAVIYGVAIAPTVLLAPAFLLLGVLATFALGTLFAAAQRQVPRRHRGGADAGPAVALHHADCLSGLADPGQLDLRLCPQPDGERRRGIRWAVRRHTYEPSLAMVAISVAGALGLLAIALSYFQRAERFFADVI